MQAFIAGYCEISLIKSVSERRNYFEPGTDEYYNRKANTSSANTIGNDTGRTSRGIECYPAGTIELEERCFKTNKEIPMVMIVRLKKVKRDSLK